jgi:predicted outer membrane repeat protein
MQDVGQHSALSHKAAAAKPTIQEATMAIWHISVAVAITVALPSAARARPVVVGDARPASCTWPALQNAIAVSEREPGTAIRFACGDAPITIQIQLPDGRFVVPDGTTINGGGRVTFNFGGAGGVFVAPETSVILKGLGLTGAGLYSAVLNWGTLVIRQSSITDNFFEAIASFGALTVTDTVFARNGCGVCGGAIYSRGPLKVNRSSFVDNGSLAGGAIWSEGPLDVANSVFRQNWGDGGGGAIFHQNGDGVISNCEFTDNGSFSGGAVLIGSGTIRISDSTFTRNHAHGPSGGAIGNGGTLTIVRTELLENSASHDGGAIYNGGTLLMRHSSVMHNRAGGDGGGIYTLTPPILRNTPIEGNSPDNVYLEAVGGSTP